MCVIDGDVFGVVFAHADDPPVFHGRFWMVVYPAVAAGGARAAQVDEVRWQVESGERVAAHVPVVEAVAAPDVVQLVAASQAPVVVAPGGQPVCFSCGLVRLI